MVDSRLRGNDKAGAEIIAHEGGGEKERGALPLPSVLLILDCYNQLLLSCSGLTAADDDESR
jgi:hypothetical protein